MPKRIGHVWEKLVSDEHCKEAVLRAIKRKKKTRYLRYIKEHYGEYATRTQALMVNGWRPDPVRRKTINEGTSQKTRELRIPSLRDHFIHTAVAMILEEHLAKRLGFYVCGSLPKRGQTFAIKAVETWIRKKRPKYCALADIKKCYKSIKKEQVMRRLRRVFKDERFLEINEKILDQMGDGLAIGFTVSHWYAHLVLSELDERIKFGNRRVFMVRFMDNYVMLCGRKRNLHKTVRSLSREAARIGLEVKGDWQVFPIASRAVEFLSYRFSHDRAVLRKGLVYKYSRLFKKAGASLDAHTARTVMSACGVLKHCDSYRYKVSYLYPYVSLKRCRRLISNADKKRLLHRRT